MDLGRDLRSMFGWLVPHASAAVASAAPAAPATTDTRAAPAADTAAAAAELAACPGPAAAARLDWMTFAGIIAPFCTAKDLLHFASTGKESATAFLSDEVWRPTLFAVHEDVLGDVCRSPRDISCCRKLYLALDAAKDSPLLQKPTNTLSAWELHEHRAWKEAVQRWLLQHRKHVVLTHLCHAEEELAQARSEVQRENAELEALKFLALGQQRRNQVVLSPEVRKAVNLKLQQRSQARRQQIQWLQDDLAGPLLGPAAA